METLNIVDEDPCCARQLNKALEESTALPSPWYCPKCGEEWRGETIEGVRAWRCHPLIEVIR